MICLFTAAELPCRLSFHPLPSPLSTPAWVHVAARVCGSVWPVTDTTLVSMTSIRLRKCTGQWVRQWTSHAVCVVSSASTFRLVYLVYVAAWLNWCHRRDATILHASLVSSALALEYRSTATLTRQTGVVSGVLRGRISVWSLPPLLDVCHFTSSRRSPCVHLPSCPGCCTRAWGLERRRFRVTQVKPNENETKFHYRFIIYNMYLRLRKTKFESLEDELWMRQREKPWISFFWKPNRGNRVFVFEFWGRFGSVFRKPISEIFIGFRTPLKSSTSLHFNDYFPPLFATACGQRVSKKTRDCHKPDRCLSWHKTNKAEKAKSWNQNSNLIPLKI